MKNEFSKFNTILSPLDKNVLSAQVLFPCFVSFLLPFFYRVSKKIVFSGFYLNSYTFRELSFRVTYPGGFLYSFLPGPHG